MQLGVQESTAGRSLAASLIMGMLASTWCACAGEAGVLVSLLAAHKAAGLPCSSMGVIAPFRSQVQPSGQTDVLLSPTSMGVIYSRQRAHVWMVRSGHCLGTSDVQATISSLCWQTIDDSSISHGARWCHATSAKFAVRCAAMRQQLRHPKHKPSHPSLRRWPFWCSSWQPTA